MVEGLNQDGTGHAGSARALDVVLAIDSDTRAYLLRELLAVPSPYLHLEEVLLQVEPLFARLPMALRRELRRFRTDVAAPGALLIRGLPTDPELPETPPRGKRAEGKKTFVSEGCSLGITQILGDVFGYESEKDGELIHQIAPVHGREQAASNEGSLLDFSPHTECGALPVIPDYLSLYCLRADPHGAAATYLVEARDACLHLDPVDIAALFEPWFEMKIPESFGGANLWSPAQSVLRGTTVLPEIWCDLNGMRATNDVGARALERLHRVLHQPSIQRAGVLQPGDMLLIDNRKVMHGRKPFTPMHNGRDRWFQRVYVRSNLWSSRCIARRPRIF